MAQKRKAAAAEAAAKRAQKSAPAPVEKKPATKSPTFSLFGGGSPKKATPEPVVVEKKPAAKSPTFSK